MFEGADEPITFESHLIRARIDPQKADPHWLFYFFESPLGRNRMQSIVHQVAAAGIRGSDLIRLAIPRVDLAEQRRVAWVLKTLDDKIETNRRAAKTLDEIASVLFKARFIEFLGCDDFVGSDIGPVPQGWTVTPVGDLARYINGKAFTRFANGRGRIVIRIAELRSGPGASTVYTDHETEPEFMANPGDILFAWSGSLDVYRWYRPAALINQHIFKVIPEGYPNWFVFQALKHAMSHFQAIAADKATTMGHIKRGDLDSFSVAVPPACDFSDHEVVFIPLFEQALAVRIESERLAQIRDHLLPRLIGGLIRVPPGEKLDLATA